MKGINVRVPLLAGAVAAALTATAWANMGTSMSTEEEYNRVIEPTALGDSKWIPASESLAADETLVATEEETLVTETHRPAPVREATPIAVREPVVTSAAETDVRQPGIRVEERRLGTDERIQAQVMDAILNTANISGKIGVESQDAVVRLSGYTMTSGQSLRAERAAGRIEGVKYIVNEIRPRMGAITS